MTVKLAKNDLAVRADWGAAEDAVLSWAAAETAQSTISSWPGYQPTPLRDLPGLAGKLGVGEIAYKDEAGRFGLGSFKALGGAYAVERLVKEKGSDVTVCCATDGNHGRSVAWGAQTFGCRCVIYLHAHVSKGREDAIAAYGAEIRRVSGGYDESVHQAQADADANGWTVVSDTSYEGYMDIPRDVMNGYTVMAQEAVDQWDGAAPPSHVFLQTGVGGLAAAVVATLWRSYGTNRPTVVLVDPALAACWFETIRQGVPTNVTIEDETIMAGLSCGEISTLTWPILSKSADFAVSIDDSPAIDIMKRLASGEDGDTPFVAGESGVAGLAGLVELCAHPVMRDQVGLTADSSVLLFGTEGATDADVYREIVGKRPEDIG